MNIRIDERTWSSLAARLLARNDVETAGLLFGEPLLTPYGTVVAIREAIQIPDSAYNVRCIDQISIDPIALNRLIRPARERGWSVFTVHTHPGASEAWFSTADDAGDMRLMPALKVQSHDAPHGSVVIVAPDRAVARTFADNFEFQTVDLRVIGRTISSLVGYEAFDDPRFSRQALALGVAGQARIRRTRVAVVGLGGIGSLVALQLAHLGVEELVLIDGDRVELSNLSRIAGAGITDVGSLKVDVMARYVERLGLPTRVETHGCFLGSEQVPVVGGCDVIVGCVDQQTPRALINRAAYRYLTPAIDLGIAFRVDSAGAIVGDAGRVVVVAPGRPCLGCWGHLDPAALRREALSTLERDQEVLDGYLEGANEPQPAVIAFNTMVAGAGVAELLRLTTAFAGADRPPCRLSFSFSEGTVRRNQLGAATTCSICGTTGQHEGLGYDARSAAQLGR